MSKKFYDIKTESNITESIKYISNSLVKIYENKDRKVVGITSSLGEKKSKFDICIKICEQISKSDKKVAFIDTDNSSESNSDLPKDFSTIICDKGISFNELSDIIGKSMLDNDLVIVNIPCVSEVADAVEYAKLCGGIVLMERYMYSTYKNYEEALIRLKLHDIKVNGVITY